MKTETTTPAAFRENKPGTLLNVFAFGNPFAGDDTAGPALLSRLRDAQADGCEFHLLRQP